MKHRAEETQMINNVLEGASGAAQVSLPVSSLLAKQMNRKRKACSSPPALLDHRSRIKIPEMYGTLCMKAFSSRRRPFRFH